MALGSIRPSLTHRRPSLVAMQLAAAVTTTRSSSSTDLWYGKKSGGSRREREMERVRE